MPNTDQKIIIMRQVDDPICPRISMGGTEQLGYYFNFRGDPLDIAIMLERVATAYKERLSAGTPLLIGCKIEVPMKK